MANSANLEQNQSAHFPYFKFDYNITQNLVQGNFSDNPQIATIQKVASLSVVCIVLVAAYETVKNGAKLFANALIFLANLGYNYMNSDLSGRKIEQINQPAVQEIEMAALPDVRVIVLPENEAVTPALYCEPTERKREGLDEDDLNVDSTPATPRANEEPNIYGGMIAVLFDDKSPLYIGKKADAASSAPAAEEAEISSSAAPLDAEEPAAPSLPVEPQVAVMEKKEEKSELQIQTEAAVTIQRAWRKHQAKKKTALENKAQEDALRNQAATTIQRAWRSHKAKKQNAVENKAATVIQRAWRDYKSRKAERAIEPVNNPAIVAETSTAAQQVLKQEPQQASGNSWNVWSWFKKSA